MTVSACGGADDPLFERLMLHGPPDGALPGGLVVESAEPADPGRPLHNNQGVRYTLRQIEDPAARAELSIVVFTHDGAVQSFLQDLWDRGAVRAVMDDNLDQQQPFAPGSPPRRDVLCVEANGEANPVTRVCMRGADRTLVVSEISSASELFAEVSFDVALLDAAADHAEAVIADE